MKRRGRFSISTSVFNKAYLKSAWSERDKWASYERHGFAQFFYLTIAGHLEAVIAAIVKARLKSIRHMLKWDELGPMKYTDNGQNHSLAMDPLVTSLTALLEAQEIEAEHAPIEKLGSFYSRIFSRTVAAVIGKELDQDMQALFKLRNLFAHSRDWYLETDGITQGHRIILDGNPLQMPAQRLHAAGIIANLDFNGNNHSELMGHLYSDEALLHFYDQVIMIENKLRNSVDFLPEKNMLFITELPDLRAEVNNQGAGSADATRPAR